MKILMISTDRKIFEENSAVRQRIIEYGKLVEELYIIVFNLKNSKAQSPNSRQILNPKLQVQNIKIYSTDSKNKFFYIWDAIKIGRHIIYNLKSKIYNACDENKILITCQDPFETGFVGWWIAKKTGAKLHLQIHTDFLNKYFRKESFLNYIRVCIAKFVLLKADGIRVVSKRIKSSLSTFNFQLSTKVSILPIFVDVKKIEEKIPTQNLMTKYSQFDFIILMASRLEKEKNIFLAIDVMKEIVKKYPKTGLVVVGEGTLKQSLQKTVCSLRLERNIIFERWNDDLVSYYKTAYLFLSTSDYEGYGMTLIEAGVSGCPILTTDVGLVGEILSEGAVEICKVGDKKCFVKKLERLLNDKNRLQEMSVKAKEEIKNRVISDNQEYLNQIKKDWERALNN